MPRRAPALRALVACALVAHAPVAAAQVFVNNTAAIPQGSPANHSNSEAIDFADVDLDGDWDAGWAEGGDWFHDQNRLWINAGGLQGGALGTFVDETDTRFPTLNDASRDIDVGDIDGDGDPDIVIANHAQILNQTSRFWINTGGVQGGSLGYFVDETKDRWVGLGGPGSTVSPAFVLAAGGFIDWSGDADFADLDNDGDLDLVHTSYGGSFGGQTPTRLFLNDGDGYFSEFNPSGFQLASSSIQNGDPAFWAEGLQFSNTSDSTGAQADIATDGVGAEIFDLDGDLDLDLAGVNWGPGGAGFNDAVYELVGTSFSHLGDLGNSGGDDEEATVIDLDHDGDLDLYVASFSGFDRLYENGAGTDVFGLTEVPTAEAGLESSLVIARDVASADVDGDGDMDVFVAYGTNPQPNAFYENTLGIPDTTPPSVFSTEAIADAPAATGARGVRVAVLDNAPLSITGAQDVHFDAFVDGVAIGAFPARWSGGQIFRASVPANLVGAVVLEPRAVDAGGNVGVGPATAYTAAGSPGTPFGVGTPSSAGTPLLRALSVPFAGEILWLGASDVGPGSLGFFGLGTTALGVPLEFGDGLTLHVLGGVLIETALVDAAGGASVALAVPPGLPPGLTFHAQFVALDSAGGATFTSSNGLTLAVF